MLKLRPYQIEMQNDAISCVNDNVNPFVVSPTGSGKMVVIASLAAHLKMRVLIIEHRIELVRQAIEKLEDIGEKPGRIVSGLTDFNPTGNIKVGMIQTIARKQALLDTWQPDAIIIDEAHLAAAVSYRNLIDRFPDSPRISFSATPWRLDGRGFRNISDELVLGPTIKSLVGQRFLVPTHYVTYNVADFTGCKIVSNDYDQDQVAMIMEELNSEIVNAWINECRERVTIVFAANTTHSKHLSDEFRKRGVAAEHIDGTTPDGIRAAIIDRVRSGQTRVLCNCGVVVEGFDAPIVSCVILAIATKSLSKFLQCCGRGMRPYDNKRELVVMDFGNCYSIHGSPEMQREWSLENRKHSTTIEYIEDADDTGVQHSEVKYRMPNYQPNQHDYGGNIEVQSGDWHRKYSQTVAKRPASVNGLAQKPRLDIAAAVRMGVKMPPSWLPPSTTITSTPRARVDESARKAASMAAASSSTGMMTESFIPPPL